MHRDLPDNFTVRTGARKIIFDDFQGFVMIFGLQPNSLPLIIFENAMVPMVENQLAFSQK